MTSIRWFQSSTARPSPFDTVAPLSRHVNLKLKKYAVKIWHMMKLESAIVQ